jgi:uncharacterized protein
MTAVVLHHGSVQLSHVSIAQTHWQKFKGLMLVRSLDASAGLLIDNCRSIHCCFMRIPIDVAFLDRERRIVHLIANMKPWRFSKYVPLAQMVLECPAGTIEEKGWRVGETLEIRESS